MGFARNCLRFLLKNQYLLFFLVIFLIEIFFRFYQMDIKNPFSYDQVDNAWAAKNIIVNHKFPLVGMIAKANSEIYVGPAYYYLISIFYWIFNLNPVASWYIAGFTGIFSFFVIFFIAKALFSKEIGIISILINTISTPAILFDRAQWPVQFLPAISLIIFYLLYKVILGDVKKIIPLAFFVGISFHIHFTAIFFPIIIALVFPLFPKTKKMLIYALASLPFFIIWIIPGIIYFITNKFAGSSFLSYIINYYHGFHLRRMIQLTGDALIQFDSYLVFEKLKPIKFLLFPLFILIFIKDSNFGKKKNLIYLILLFFLVPWLILTVYSGEISDYYFSLNRYIVLILVSYIVYKLWLMKKTTVKIFLLTILTFYLLGNINKFIAFKSEDNLIKKENIVKQSISKGSKIEFQQGAPESYLYYYYMRQKGIEIYE